MVIGIAVDGGEDTLSRTQKDQEVEGYKLSRGEEMEGDIGEGEATPTLPRWFDPSESKPASSQVTPETAFDHTLSSLFPSTSPFPLVKRLVVVPNPSLGAHASKERKDKREGEVWYAPQEGLGQWMTQLVGGAVGDALGELGVIAASLETPSGLQTLSSTILPSLTCLPPPSSSAGTVGNSDNSFFPHSRSKTPNSYISTDSTTSSTSRSTPTIAGDVIGKVRCITPGGIPSSAATAGAGVTPTQLPIEFPFPIHITNPTSSSASHTTSTSSSALGSSPINTSATGRPSSMISSSSSSLTNPFRRSLAVSSPFSRSSSSASMAGNGSPASSSLTITGGVGGVSPGVSPSPSPSPSPAPTYGPKSSHPLSRYTSLPLPSFSSSTSTDPAIPPVAIGRLLKIIADFLLLSGLFSDSIVLYDEAIQRCKEARDVLWEAAGREGRAVAGIEEGWGWRGGGTQTQPFPSSPIPNEIFSQFVAALGCISSAPLLFPESSPEFDAGSGSESGPQQKAGRGAHLLAYLYAALALRSAHFLLIVWAAGGWGEVALGCLVRHELPRSFLPPIPHTSALSSVSPAHATSTSMYAQEEKRRSHLRVLSASSQIPRHFILSLARLATSAPILRCLQWSSSADSGSSSDSSGVEEVVVWREVGWIARLVGMERKEGWIGGMIGEAVVGMLSAATANGDGNGAGAREGRDGKARRVRSGTVMTNSNANTTSMVGTADKEDRRLSTMSQASSSSQTTQTTQTTQASQTDTDPASASASVGLGLGMSVPISSAHTTTSETDSQTRPGSGGITIRRKEVTQGNAGIFSILSQQAKVLGIEVLRDVFPVERSVSVLWPPAGSGRGGNKGKDKGRGLSSGGIVGVDDELGVGFAATGVEDFGWASLKLEFLKKSITLLGNLPDHPNTVRLALIALHLLPSLSHRLALQSGSRVDGGTQMVLNRVYIAALGVMKRRRLGVYGTDGRGEVGWWVPGRVVVSLEVASLPKNKYPTRHSTAELVSQTTGSNGMGSKMDGKGQGAKRDPFLYNPRTSRIGISMGDKTVLVANEPIEVFVTLRNPFAFPMNIKDMSIITSGVPLHSQSYEVSIPALSIQTVRLSALAPGPGIVQIRGISLRLSDGSAGDFYLPLLDVKECEKRERQCQKQRIRCRDAKRSGMDQRTAWEKEIMMNEERVREEKENLESLKWLECEVVAPLPLAWIKSTSLTHGMVMLYNGETSTIQITLENASPIPINYLKLSFEDSTVRAATRIAQDNELGAEEAYELDWDVRNRSVFTWENPVTLGAGEGEEGLIIPGGRKVLKIKCLGKVGCTEGLVRIDYGHVHSSSLGSTQTDDAGFLTPTTPSATFYTRQITFPVLFTVTHTLECHSLDITHLGHCANNGLSAPELNDTNKLEIQEEDNDDLRKALTGENNSAHCLVGLSVANVYGVPFEVCLSRKGKRAESEDIECRRLIPPGATERLIVPIPRKSIPQDTLSQPIPSFSERQYVVDKEKKSASRIALERELFWYREALLDMLDLTWTEPGSQRHGSLILRNQILTPSLLQVFRADAVDIRVILRGRGKDGDVRTMDFVDLVVEVTNNLERPYRPYISLACLPTSSTDYSWARPTSIYRPPPTEQHSHAHPHRNVLFDSYPAGTLTMLQKGEKDVYEVGTTFLASGKYGFRASVEEIKRKDEEGDVEQVEGKKVWFSPVLQVQVV